MSSVLGTVGPVNKITPPHVLVFANYYKTYEGSQVLLLLCYVNSQRTPVTPIRHLTHQRVLKTGRPIPSDSPTGSKVFL